ncbi:decarboxylase [Jiella endophytica]|uniref:Decarboxylase n=1 Tax=Jiella endophytica TaxID=2558362 RepID=A0A4Y8RUS3_9HYPH|nr:aspartate/glutamate racemase family protein [Jiella endophytica]TFF27693.1 decarboxylase [Jiella endophytica]
MPSRHQSTYSTRAKLGLIVPPTNTVNEAEWVRMAPEGVTIHSHRVRLHADTASPAGQAALLSDLDEAVGLVAQTGADAVAYACTAGSMVTPAASLQDELTERTGTPCVTTSAAIVAALSALGARRISVATPYAETLNAHEAEFLAVHGFDVLSIAGLGIGAGGPSEYPRIARTPLDAVADHARNAFSPESDALLIACTDFPTLPLVARLEAELGVPVVTSNQATFWSMLRVAGIDDRFERFGRLLAEH